MGSRAHAQNTHCVSLEARQGRRHGTDATRHRCHSAGGRGRVLLALPWCAPYGQYVCHPPAVGPARTAFPRRVSCSLEGTGSPATEAGWGAGRATTAASEVGETEHDPDPRRGLPEEEAQSESGPRRVTQRKDLSFGMWRPEEQQGCPPQLKAWAPHTPELAGLRGAHPGTDGEHHMGSQRVLANTHSGTHTNAWDYIHSLTCTYTHMQHSTEAHAWTCTHTRSHARMHSTIQRHMHTDGPAHTRSGAHRHMCMHTQHSSTCTELHTHVCSPAHMHTCACTAQRHMHTWTYIILMCTSVDMHVCTAQKHMYTHRPTYTRAHARVCAQQRCGTCTHRPAHIWTRVSITAPFISTCTYMNLHTNLHAHMHTCVHVQHWTEAYAYAWTCTHTPPHVHTCVYAQHDSEAHAHT